MKQMTIKPIVKYIGGKSWLGDKLREKLEIVGAPTSYGEAFFGGGGSFFQVVNQLNCPTVYINDISTPVISLYTAVMHSPDELLEFYDAIEDGFSHTCPDIMTSDKTQLQDAKAYFETIKGEFNKGKSNPTDRIALASYFMFLQQHSFNGIYRENKKGEYNTPFNWKGSRFPIEEMRKRVYDVVGVYQRFDNVIFSNVDVFDLDTSSGTWYFDPPYINDAGGENAYSTGGFSTNHQLALMEKVKECEAFIYSNHNVQLITDGFAGYDYEIVGRRNIMSAKADNRNEVRNEILIWVSKKLY